MSEVCADCGKPITMGQGSYYQKNLADDLGHSYHAECGDRFSVKAKDAEITRLRARAALLRLITSQERCTTASR